MKASLSKSTSPAAARKPLPEIRSSLASPVLARSSCACGGVCPRCQKKSALPIGEPHDAAEQEADQIADQLMGGFAAVTPPADPPRPAVLRRRSNGAGSSIAPPIVHDTLSTPGASLDSATRGFFERGLGRDFGDVRIHTGASAAASARAVNAIAYTVGRDIVFDEGRYAPQTNAGRHLLAHELTHVVQQSDAAPRLQRQDGHPGTSVYTEHMGPIMTSLSQPGVWSGVVNRNESTRSGRLFYTGRAPVHYDENSCQVAVPMVVRFRDATLTDVQRSPPQLNEPAPTTMPAPVAPAEFRRIANLYLQSMNEDLNGWYSVRFNGCPNNRCHGQTMPIRVQVREARTGENVDYDIAIANLSGRSAVNHQEYLSGRTGTVLLYALGLDRSTMAHEGGHMVLGHNDEYRETQQPGPLRPLDRVREGDYSRQESQNAHGRFALLHERHFAFVPAFLNHVRPGCDARLVEQPRSHEVEGGLGISLGYMGFPHPGGIGSGMYVGGVLTAGMPLERLRRWQLLVSGHIRYISQLHGDYRTAFLLGIRVGIERTITPSAGGFNIGIFGEMGGSLPLSSLSTSSSWSNGVYAEAGGHAGYRLASGTPLHFMFQVEAAYGAIWAQVMGPSVPVPRSTEILNFFRLGINLIGRF
jgi:hypothetical protein